MTPTRGVTTRSGPSAKCSDPPCGGHDNRPHHDNRPRYDNVGIRHKPDLYKITDPGALGQEPAVGARLSPDAGNCAVLLALGPVAAVQAAPLVEGY